MLGEGEGGRVWSGAGGPGGTSCHSAFLFAATDNFPARFGNRFTPLLYLSHCFAAIGGSVFVLFYKVIYCHVLVLIFS